ncbi:glycosyltransferase family 25 protein [Roseicyclus persicicus]|uniref:Glycosyltransferase family 25 protein n=1 Tax=Roseicyclus persicicus TaxID=2650661 RepID=A0A7X6GYG9_9RHOB|nr:glycosyltransferase family 25 protein [Roseibacterium persicicum]NKX44720.1 glycosyltransferase family 25 protein [Roseibacterium persicicum]
MAQAIPVYVINLDRRPDRLERIGAHLAARGVAFHRQPACDAQAVPEPEIAAVVRTHGPLGQLGLGDRACTVSHTRAWEAFLASDAAHALFLEDDITLAADIAAVLADDAWIPPGCHAVKLEKFNAGASKLLLAPEIGHTPTGRALHPMRSRHVGGGAYILSREGARLALAHKGRFRVPVDHFLFNDTVSPIRRGLGAAIVVPAMATQRAQAYESDIAPLGKAIRPEGWKKRLRALRRGLAELNQAPRQLWQWATGRARIVSVAYAEDPPAP